MYLLNVRAPSGLFAWVAASLCLAVAGCSSSEQATPIADTETQKYNAPAVTGESSTLVGKISVDGSSTVAPISDAVAEEFKKLHPKVVVNVSGNGTGNGFKSFAAKETDISDASRPIKPGEYEKLEAADIEFVELAVAYDGLTIAVNPKNTWVKQLTVEQLQKMFLGKDAAKKWSDLDPSWPKDDIQIFSPGTGSGTYDYFREVVTAETGKELRNDMELNEDDNILVQGIAGSPNAIGFFGVAYYTENQDKLRAVPIVNAEDGKAYEPTVENIAGNLYAPFSRPLFIYVNADSLDRAEVQTFVEYYLDNVAELCERVGYVQLPESMLERSSTLLDEIRVGTHFVDDEGNSRKGALADIYTAENL